MDREAELIEFAMSYDGYERIADTPEALNAFYEPYRVDARELDRIPGWAGTDFLRGWLFLLQREHYFSGGGDFTWEWIAVTEALRNRRSSRGETSSPPWPGSMPVPPGEAMLALCVATSTTSTEWQLDLAPGRSIHEGCWYATETDPSKTLIDDQVWAVLPTREVRRLIPVGNPIHEPSPLA